MDHQVKLRGFRIELGEIESVLATHPLVRQATVLVVREDIPEEKMLAAYMVMEGKEKIEDTDIRDFLAKRLPDYMIPTVFVTIDAIPLTPNGKLDRKALPEPILLKDRQIKSFTKPRTPLEKKIASIWKEVFGIDEIGVHENFFEIGGHSLLATQLIMKLRNVLGLDIPLRHLFDSPTIEGIAKSVENIIINRESGWSLYKEPDLIEEARLEQEISPQDFYHRCHRFPGCLPAH